MIKFVLAIAIVVGVAVMFYNSQDSGPAQANESRIETGWQNLDTLLDDGLSDGTHSAISTTLTGSADFLHGWGDGVAVVVDEVATP